MLRVGLTGGLGSGKSTVARLLAERGATVLSSDEMARALMRPGQAVYEAIVKAFGQDVVLSNGELHRAALARIAFEAVPSRIEELNAIVHPAVLAEQARMVAEIAKKDARAIVVVESALIFTTNHAGERPWRERFDVIVLVTAPETTKIARFVQRVAAGRTLSESETLTAEADARRRLTLQRPTADHAGECVVLANHGRVEDLAESVDVVWGELMRMERERFAIKTP